MGTQARTENTLVRRESTGPPISANVSTKECPIVLFLAGTMHRTISPGIGSCWVRGDVCHDGLLLTVVHQTQKKRTVCSLPNQCCCSSQQPATAAVVVLEGRDIYYRRHHDPPTNSLCLCGPYYSLQHPLVRAVRNSR